MINNIVVSICNDAILEAGNSATIHSLSDNSQLAELCNRLWKPTIDEMYADYSWAFRKVRSQSVATASAQQRNVFRYVGVDSTTQKNIYSIPDDCIRILGFYVDAGYQIEESDARVGARNTGEQVVFSGRAPLFIEYLTCSGQTNDKPSPLVRKCLTYLLAAKIATSQGKDDQKIIKKYEYWLDRAEENDCGEDEKVHTYDDRFIDCR